VKDKTVGTEQRFYMLPILMAFALFLILMHKEWSDGNAAGF
jgi:hypothetical protein